ncbi:DUF6703 family protein [Phytomonospora endophytica]|uniref:Uncharacterized protein n=1 Tax=Phytomonospora endophytica TaxID=714109 RepID=A0A841FA43_9ACTN|nr:DUF6703 family protein [Phytomonospora endophytica]MBB6034111.1 hypothetical protein [Phytomonospora endophytica]GIG66505.1 hypothetical protein Pen01_28000 [Phytomonospora endophytica]
MVDHNATPEADEAPVRWLLWLERLPKVAVFLAVLVVTLGMLFTPGIPGAVLVLLLAAATGYLIYSTWSKFGTRMRVARVLVVVMLAAMGVAKLFM